MWRNKKLRNRILLRKMWRNRRKRRTSKKIHKLKKIHLRKRKIPPKRINQ